LLCNSNTNKTKSTFVGTTAHRLGKVDTRTDDEIDKEIVTYLARTDIDSWQLRKTLPTAGSLERLYKLFTYVSANYCVR